VSLTISSNGMKTFQSRINRTADNLANVQTPGFHAHRSQPEPVKNQSGSTPSSGSLKTTRASIRNTGRDLDLSLNGNGFLKLETGSGTGFVRTGRFGIDARGQVVHIPSGDRLIGENGPVRIDSDEPIDGINVRENGRLEVQFANNSTTSAGRIEVARFRNPAGLLRGNDGILKQTANSGEPRDVTPGRGVQVQQGRIETSNVSVVDQLLSLERDLRFFQMNSRAFNVKNEMLRRISTTL